MEHFIFTFLMKKKIVAREELLNFLSATEAYCKIVTILLYRNLFHPLKVYLNALKIFKKIANR